MPILETVYKVLNREIKPDEALKILMTREKKEEQNQYNKSS